MGCGWNDGCVLCDPGGAARRELQPQIDTLTAELSAARAENARLAGEVAELDASLGQTLEQAQRVGRAEHEMAQKCDALRAHVARLEAVIGEVVDALIWCSGSADFGPGGQAHQGWLRVQPLITRALDAARGEGPPDETCAFCDRASAGKDELGLELCAWHDSDGLEMPAPGEEAGHE